MQQKRTISITADADNFLQSYGIRLLRDGYSRAVIEQLALELYEVIFELLPRGSLARKPHYIGLDPDLPKFSRYMFSEGYVTGLYSSRGDHVVVYSLGYSIPPSAVALRGATAA